jgi:hypothetical protein
MKREMQSQQHRMIRGQTIEEHLKKVEKRRLSVFNVIEGMIMQVGFSPK